MKIKIIFCLSFFLSSCMHQEIENAQKKLDSLQIILDALKPDRSNSDSLSAIYSIDLNLPLSGKYFIKNTEYSLKSLEKFLHNKQEVAGKFRKLVWIRLDLDPAYKIQDKPFQDLLALVAKLEMRCEMATN